MESTGGGGDDSVATSTSSSTTGDDSSSPGATTAGGVDDGDSSNSTSGGDGNTSGEVEFERVSEGLLVLYLLNETSGDTIHDTSGFGAPLDLTLTGGGFVWRNGGLVTDGSGVARSDAEPSKVRSACLGSEELTLEAWVTPEFGSSEPPGRIVSYSPDRFSRNFHLAQGRFIDDGSGYTARIRTTQTDQNGYPDVPANVSVSTELTHLLYTRESNGVDSFYVNGVRVTRIQQQGSFSGWSSSFRMAVGNDHDLSSPFRGTIHLIAIYDRALDADEVLRNFEVGPQ